MTSNEGGGPNTSGTHLLVLVEQAEALRAQIVADALVARALAEAFEERSSGESAEISLGSCCRLVHWVLIQVSEALEPLTAVAGDATAITLNAYWVTCDEQRLLLLWSEATLTAVRQLMTVIYAEHQSLSDELASVGSLRQSLSFAAVSLATLKGLAANGNEVEQPR